MIISKWLTVTTLLLSTLVNAATWDDYTPAIGAEKKAAIISRADTKAWSSEWVGLGDGSVIWRNPNDPTDQGSVEHWGLGDGWYRIRAFGPWPVTCVRAEVIDLQTGRSNNLNCTDGHQYVPFLIPADPFAIRIWGLVAGTLKFYWQANFYTNEQATNTCWVGGSNTQSVIREQENWWDSGNGWMNKGTFAVPFNGSTPIDVNVPMAREATVAKNYGVWTLHDLYGPTANIQFCLYSIWTWGK